MNKLITLIDSKLNPSNIINLPKHIISGVLEANTNTKIPVPIGARVMIFGVSGAFWLSINGQDAQIPTNTTPEAGHCIYLPNTRLLDERHISTTKQTKYLNLIAPGEVSYSIAFYK